MTDEGVRGHDAFSANREADVIVLSIWGFQLHLQVVNKHQGNSFVLKMIGIREQMAICVLD